MLRNIDVREYFYDNCSNDFDNFFYWFTNTELSVDLMRELFLSFLNEEDQNKFTDMLKHRMKRIAYYFSRDIKIVAFDMDSFSTDKNVLTFIQNKISNDKELIDYLGVAEYKFFSGKYEKREHLDFICDTWYLHCFSVYR